MPHQRSEQFELFEIGLFMVGGARPYLRNIMELARMLPASENDIARAIDENAVRAIRQVERAQAAQSELANMVGYKYLRLGELDHKKRKDKKRGRARHN